MLKPRQAFTRKQVKEDKFLKAVAQFQEFIEKEWQRIAIIGISAVVLVAVVVIILNGMRSKERAASSKLYEIESIYIERQLYNESLVLALQDYLKKYKNTKSGSAALFYLGTAYYNTGKYPEAEEQYKNFLKTGDGADFMKSSALAGVAASYEQRTLYKEASEYYLRAVREYPDVFITPDNMLGAARNLALIGKTTEAIAQCKDVISKYPDTNEAKKAQVLMSRL